MFARQCLTRLRLKLSKQLVFSNVLTLETEKNIKMFSRKQLINILLFQYKCWGGEGGCISMYYSVLLYYTSQM